MRLHSSFGTRRPAFTLVELLVVIGIIAGLAAILFPVIGKVREAARETDTRAFISSLESACQNYKSTFNAYPGPLTATSLSAATQEPVFPLTGSAINTGSATTADAVTGPRITGAENMVLGLLGGLTVDRTTTPPTLRFDPTTVGQGPATLNPVRPGRSGVFMQMASLSTGVFTDDNGSGTTSFDTVIPEFVDRWPQAMPILVLRARVGGRAVNGAGATYTAANNDVVVNASGAPGAVGQYNLIEITPYTQSTIGAPRNLKPTEYRPSFDAMKPHGLTGTSDDATKLDSKVIYPYVNALSYLADPATVDPTITNGSDRIKKMRARKQDTIILISAGRDRVYGTNDDVANFGSVMP